MRSTTPRVLLSLLVLVCLTCDMARADGVIRDGIGPISTGRGATNLAFADNGAIIHDNPAAMSNIDGCSLFELGVDTVVCGLQYTDPDNPDVNGIHRGYPAGMVSYVRRVPDSCWSYGIGVFAPAGFGAEYNMQSDLGLVKYESLGLMGKLLPALAYQWSDRLSIGASLGLALAHNELEGPFYVNTALFGPQPALLDFQGTGAAICGGLGLQYLLTPSTTIGIAYTEQTHFELDGRASASNPLLGASDFDAAGTITWPRSLGIGLKHDACCRRYGIDIIWYNWSDAFDEFGLVLSEGSNPAYAAFVGDPIREALPMRWKDTVSYRFGFEWDATECVTWRLGYVYHDSPVPNATLNPYLDGTILHTFSAGLSYGLPRGIVNFAYQYMHGPERQVGDSEIPGDDFSDSTFAAQAHWFNLSLLIPY